MRKKMIRASYFFSVILLMMFGQSTLMMAAEAKTSTNSFSHLLIENCGQIKSENNKDHNDILFYVRSSAFAAFISSDRISYQFIASPTEEGQSFKSHRFDLELVGANTQFDVKYGKVLPFKERMTSNGQTIESNSFESITIENIYPQIDWVIYTTASGLKYDFNVKPGGDPSLIRIHYSNCDNVEMQNDGSIQISSKLGSIRENAPISFQGNQSIDSHFRLDGRDLLFDVDPYDHSKTLTIDPDVLWSSYYGGSGYDEASASCVDFEGNIYVVGFTSAINTVATGGFQNTYGGGNYDAYIAKFSMDGQRLWASYFGGSGSDFGENIAIDDDGNLVITGTSSSADLTNGGVVTTFQGGAYDAFYAMLTSEGEFYHSGFIGGSATDEGVDVAFTDAQRFCVLVKTNSTNVSTTDAVYHGGTDMLMASYYLDGTADWSKYVGGENDDVPYCMETMNDGSLLIGGSTNSLTGIANNGAQGSFGGGDNDGSLFHIDADGGVLWATYMGGPADDWINGITINNTGQVFVAGSTSSTSGIATPNAFQTDLAGGEYDSFIAQVGDYGVKDWSSYFGGEGDDRGVGVAYDELGNIYLGGTTTSLTNIGASGFQNQISGGVDLMFAYFDSLGVKIWSSYYGGINDENMNHLAPDENSKAVFCGTTSSPAAAINGWETIYSGATDGFFGKVQDCANPYVTVDILGMEFFCEGESVGFSVGGADSFEWSTGDSLTVISVDTTMFVYAVGTIAATGCKGRSNAYFVEMLPAPEVSAFPEGDTEFCENGSVVLTADSPDQDITFTWSTSEAAESITVTEEGSYTVNAEAPNGCISTSDPIEITIHEPSEVLVAIADETACISEDYVPMIALPTGGTFVGTGVDGTHFIPALAGGGTHIIQYVYLDENGCETASEELTIEVLFETTILFVDDNDMCVNDAPVGMTGFPEGGYYTGPGVSGNMFYPEISGPGNHTVSYIYNDANGCANRAEQLIHVDACNGVGEFEKSNVKLYPNPAADVVYFDLMSWEPNALQIFNAIGQEVRFETLSKEINTVDVSELTPGLYTIVFVKEHESRVTQFMKH
ncbi:MAG: SBBP repeat-containing protein [Flavobacteriales bacterium]